MREKNHLHAGEHSHEHSDPHNDHQPGHEHGGSSHGHTHGTIDASLTASERGLWAVKWAFIGLGVTTVIQVAIYYYSSSIALLADAIHNVGDAGTALPLGIAFLFSNRKPTKRFTYGFGRIEDLAGLVVVLTILASAAFAGYESIDRFFHPHEVSHLWAVALGGIVGFLGNEGVAIFRIKVGKEMGSAALVADGYHARTDGIASLAVVVSAIGVYLGYPLADPVIGILMTILILRIVWESSVAVFTRILDGVGPEIPDQIKNEARKTGGVVDVSEVRVRWLGHRMHAELNVAVAESLSVEAGHEIALAVRHDLLHNLQFLSDATIHVDPANASGETHHRIEEHKHGEESPHSH